MKIPTECTCAVRTESYTSPMRTCGEPATVWYTYDGRSIYCRCGSHKVLSTDLPPKILSTYDDAVAYQAMREL